MSLPTIKNATFTVKIDEFPKPIKVRPMVVSEHKSIQQAIDIGSEDDAALTIADITSACTNNIINGNDTPQYILDFFFLQLYMTSVENVVNSSYRCYGRIKDEEGNIKLDEETGDPIKCDTSINVQIPLSDATIMYPEGFAEKSLIAVSDNVKMKLKCLSLQSNLEVNSYKTKVIEIVEKINIIVAKEEQTEEDNKEFKLLNDELLKVRDLIKLVYVFNSIDYIDDGENQLKPGVDFNQQEFSDWLDECPSIVNTAIEQFYDKTPTIGLDIHIKCAKCGNTSDTQLRGLQDFFS